MSTDTRLSAVEAAVRAKDEAALAKALKALGESYLWGSLELCAHRRLEAGEHELAFGLLRVVVDGKRPSLSAWNNLCYVLNAWPGRPDIAIAEPLLERALAAAPSNPFIFHNLACAAVKYSRYELALEAVAGAAKYGYAEMDRVRADEELAPIAPDPRFAKALEATIRWTPEELDELTLRLALDGETHVVHRAVMGMTFHFGGRLAEVSPRLVGLLDAYLADIPEGALRFYGPSNFKPLTKAMTTKTRNQLATPRRDFIHIDFRPADGDAGPFEFFADGDEEDGAVTVFLAFPLAEAKDPDAFEARFLRYVALVEPDTGHAGYSFTNRDVSEYEGISWNRTDFAKRFLGAQNRNPWWRPGRAAPAHWLTWLGPALTKKLGAPSLGDARTIEAAGGVAIRAAKLPPVARRRRLEDVGALPDVARALAPLRIQAIGADNIAYLARWDGVKSTPWDNAPEGWTPTPIAPSPKEPPPKKKRAKKRSFFDA